MMTHDVIRNVPVAMLFTFKTFEFWQYQYIWDRYLMGNRKLKPWLVDLSTSRVLDNTSTLLESVIVAQVWSKCTVQL